MDVHRDITRICFSYVDFQGYCRMWKHKTFICKPDNSCQGKGIYITRQPRDIDPEEHIICQSYISKVTTPGQLSQSKHCLPVHP